MTARKLKCVLLSAVLGWPAPALAVDFYWQGQLLGGPGGNFRTAQNWTYTPPPFPLQAAPGGADDTANFDLGRDSEDRYTVRNVDGVNDQLLVHSDSLRLEIDDYQLLSEDDANRSLVVGAGGGDIADVVFVGVGNSTLRSKDVFIGLGVASIAETVVDHLQWDVDGEIGVAGFGGNGNGKLTIQNGSQVASDVAAIGTWDGSLGEVVISNSNWAVAGSITVGNAGSGMLTIHSDGAVSSSGGSILSNSTVTVDGTGAVWNVGSQIRMWQHPNATLVIQNGGRVNAEDPMLAIRANSSSEITLDSGGILDARGEIEMNTGAFNFLGGTLHVETFDHHLVNQGGTLAPGNADVPAGSTVVTGNYTHQAGATLAIDIGGTGQGTQYDFVDVQGTASMAGILQLSLVDEFVPDADDQFVVFNTATLWLGSFSNVASGQRLYMADGAGSFLVHYGPTSIFNANQVVLTQFVPGLPGDYNDDGVVDAADYTVWRDRSGEEDSLPNDDSPGVGPDDYDRWKQHFGESTGGGAVAGGADSSSVPEPLAIFLSATGMIFLLSIRQKKRGCPAAFATEHPLR
jgi:T5SS/PEP-CTERM-associated repeat protein